MSESLYGYKQCAVFLLEQTLACNTNIQNLHSEYSAFNAIHNLQGGASHWHAEKVYFANHEWNLRYLETSEI